MNSHLTIHIALSIITSIVLCAAGLMALILAIQEHWLRAKPGSNLIQRLPPLITMEKYLFRVMVVGFILLSLLLVTSDLIHRA